MIFDILHLFQSSSKQFSFKDFESIFQSLNTDYLNLHLGLYYFSFSFISYQLLNMNNCLGDKVLFEFSSIFLLKIFQVQQLNFLMLSLNLLSLMIVNFEEQLIYIS